MYAKRTLSTNCTLQRVSRARETHISKITCRLVYVRRYILEKSCVSCTPNTYFGWWTTPSRMGMDEATMANTFQKVVSRARQMHTFKKLHSPASVSSTRDTHLQNQVLSRLRETLFVLINCSFVYAKPPLREAKPSPAQPSRPEPSRACLRIPPPPEPTRPFRIPPPPGWPRTVLGLPPGLGPNHVPQQNGRCHIYTILYGKSCSSNRCAGVVRRGCAGGLCGGLCGIILGVVRGCAGRPGEASQVLACVREGFIFQGKVNNSLWYALLYQALNLDFMKPSRSNREFTAQDSQ